MSMFDTYQEDTHFSTNSVIKRKHKFVNITNKVPFVRYDDSGNINLLAWSNQSRFEFEVPLNPSIGTRCDSLVFETTGKEPTVEDARINRLCYNLVDNKCWKCNKIGEWELQDSILGTIPADKFIRMNPQNVVSCMNILDFRGKILHTFNNNNLIFDDELVTKLSQGFYILEVIVNQKCLLYKIPISITSLPVVNDIGICEDAQFIRGNC